MKLKAAATENSMLSLRVAGTGIMRGLKAGKNELCLSVFG